MSREIKNADRILLGKCDWKTPLGRYGLRWKYKDSSPQS
jgi:hypothetical protein